MSGDLKQLNCCCTGFEWNEGNMKSIEEAIEFIESLPKEDFYKLRDWILERDWEKWDREIEEDSKSGRLDFLIKQALDEKKKGF